jgi:hypothetical protein
VVSAAAVTETPNSKLQTPNKAQIAKKRSHPSEGRAAGWIDVMVENLILKLPGVADAELELARAAVEPVVMNWNAVV